MEISQGVGEDTQVDVNSEYDVCSESGQYEGLDKYEPDLEEILP